MIKPPAIVKPPLTIAMPKPTAPPKVGARAVKTFSVVEWSGSGQGKKILLYGPNGMGKTTLASMAPNAVFIGLDDGGREIRHPKTGAKLRAIPGVESFEDLRDALHQPDLFAAGATLVLDTITMAEAAAAQYLFRTVRLPDKSYATNLEDYGYGKGFNYLLDPMRLLLADMDPLVRRGVNILLLAQQGQGTVSNLGGMDYSQDGPTLESRPKSGANVRAEVVGWVDNVFRIGYPDVSVEKASKDAKKGKAQGTTDRQIFTEPEVHFIAKNRMNGTLPPVVSFATRDDDSIWQFLFAEAK